MYRDRLKGVHILLSNSQAGPGKTVKQEQEEISRNHVQVFIPDSVHALKQMSRPAGRTDRPTPLLVIKGGRIKD